MQADVLKLLKTTPPALIKADAELIAADHFGILAQAKLLVSERDQNFRLDAEDGKRYTLKIANHAEQLRVIDFQNRALRYVAERDASIPLPRVIPTRNGKLHCRIENDGKTHIVRLLSWLDGVLLHDLTPGPELANTLGRLLARLGLALQGFDHPGSNPPLLWDMKRAAGLRELLVHIKEPGLGQLIEQTLDRFDACVQPVLLNLRTQVIYNDLNPDNVLLDKANPQRISGIIDFGDLVNSPLIIDLAVAAAYQLAAGDDPLAGALPLIAGYHAVRPLQNVEMELLTDLIRTRLITTLLIMSWRSRQFPDNREYLLRSHASALAFLTGLKRLNADVALERIGAACNAGRLALNPAISP